MAEAIEESEYRYERLTWQESDHAAQRQKVVVLPVGATEQHGHHLPLDTDTTLCSAIAYEAARRDPEEMLVLPPVPYGYTHHVMDFPGTINIEPVTFVHFLLDIVLSVAFHGFKRIIILNGHGSNAPLIQQVGRQATLQSDALCMTLSWWQLSTDFWNREVRTSVVPGGCAHACELETSVYMHLDGEHVRADRIQGDLPDYMRLPGAEQWQYVDLTAGSGPISLVEWTSSYTQSGAVGQPEEATAEKGRRVFEHAASRMVELVHWFRSRPAPERHDHHATAPTFRPPFGFA